MLIIIFYAQLKKACGAKNTTISAVLKDLGIGVANGTYWKRGSSPSAELVVKLADYLDVSTDYLLKGDDLITASKLPQDAQLILKLYDSLDEKSKAKAEGFLEALADQDKS